MDYFLFQVKWSFLMNFRKILALFILSSFPLYGMESRLVRWIPALAQGAGFIGSVGLPSADALFTYNVPVDKNLPDMPGKVAQYVRSYLKELGVQNTDSLILKMDGQHDWAVAGTNGLIGPKKTVEELEKLLNTQKIATNHELLIATRSTLAHEASHLINSDNKRRQRMVPVIALCVTLAGNRVMTLLQKKFFPEANKKISGASILSLLYLTSVMPKLQATFALDTFHQRYNEIKADNFAFHNGSRKELEYTVEFYKQRHETLKKSLEQA